ncbi:DUF4129 domain-containing protein [Rathayibacter iranicus]|uniref:DUF4129 domain-containing protein n=2 Tax=Rathayibacter iranicus TaxID=59737 RepID=A0AAD1EMH5_9MICO|nr:DUF4129 domain-containing protein [Rathayibacter iranicus]AZZ55770.1 DUF4129 domain-containing protein [Rathayibacter iranicus]MWV30806.1 DUF4129 domain-containing protein [Rathayibacter iranicus NCPPB 2253 = VKM Ac-1602]PPI47538.1 DUF4129 domain-containing protein [Rathayibacter iranicus]PPI60383.1 DUF4129 domain-containing protein [Rathayibacter iranicus]PPI72166.1 DUF4129 domain-containing protein [Rathayibacter iranicus]
MIRSAVPLDPDAEQARSLLLEELADPRYRAAEPNLFDRVVQAIRDWFADLTLQGDGPSVPVAAVIGVLVLVALVVAALLIAGRPRTARRSTVMGAVLAADDTRSAATLRALADAAAARGAWDEALVERFRALVRALDERTVLRLSPGTTAHGLASRASAAFPASASTLRRTADDFDRVRYLGLPCGPAEYERVAALDRELAATAPVFEPLGAAR